MYNLIVDSSTKTLYVALLTENEVISERYLVGKNDHAKNILVQIEEILKSNNLEISKLDRIICGQGPGSYTGVRMAVTIGKMVAVNSNVKLYGISTLYLMSSYYDGKVLSYIDARRGNSFNAVYDNDIEVLTEGLRPTLDILKEYNDYQIVDEDSFKVNPLKVLKKAKLINNPHGFIPNYLRETEAERNKKND